VIAALPGPELDTASSALFADGCAGGVCLYGRNIVDPVQARNLTDAVRLVAGHDVLISCNLEGGYVWRLKAPATHWPSAMAFGAANRPDLTRQAATMAAREMRAMGIDASFAPVADVCDHPRNSVIGSRAFGSVASHVARHVAAAIGGYRDGGVASCAKHFPGHGHTDIDSHDALPVVTHDIARIDCVDLVPFVEAIRAGVDMVMVSHLLVKAIDTDLPASLSPKVISGLLREQLGFRGVIVTDALDMRAITETYGLAEAAVRAVAAGCDLIAFNAPVDSAREIHAALTTALTSGRLSGGKVRASRERVRALRRSLARNLRPPLSVVGDASHGSLVDRVAQLALAATGEAIPLITRAPGQTVVIEFDPRLPFDDPDVHAPTVRLSDVVANRCVNTLTHVIAPSTWSSQAEPVLRKVRVATRVIVATRNAWRDDRQREALIAIGTVATDLTVLCYAIRKTRPSCLTREMSCRTPMTRHRSAQLPGGCSTAPLHRGPYPSRYAEPLGTHVRRAITAHADVLTREKLKNGYGGRHGHAT
jgi:beta-glucosidase-like glycosyl hydrolase